MRAGAFAGRGAAVVAAVVAGTTAALLPSAPTWASSPSQPPTVRTRTVPSLEPVSPLDESAWRTGLPATATTPVCTDPSTCSPVEAVTARVDYQGAPAAAGADPRVRDRFYVHVRTAVVLPTTLEDTYRMRVRLPTGTTAAILTPEDVKCAVTDLAGVQTRDMTAQECVDPVRVGADWVFAPVLLTQGEAAHFFLPVSASTIVPGGAVALDVEPVGHPLPLTPATLTSSVPLALTAVVPAKVGTIKAVFPRAGLTTVSWRPSTSDGGSPVTRYEVRWRRVSLARWGRWTSTALVRARAVAGLLKGVAYDVQVRAVNAKGPGPARALRFRPTR